MTTEKNVRGLARARGYRLSKIRNPFVKDEYMIVDTRGIKISRGVKMTRFTLVEAEEWLREQPTLERGR